MQRGANISTLNGSIVGLCMGVPMGYAFRYSSMSSPTVIKAQLELRDWRMMKTFLSALSVGGLCVCAAYASSDITLSSRPFNSVTTPLGGALLGAGMYLVGSCPGTIWAQVGAGVQDSSFIMLGGVLGSVTFAFVKDFLPATTKGLLLHSDVLGMPYLQVALPIFGGIVAGLVGNELWNSKKGKQIFYEPYVAGAVIGLLQLPALYFINTMLGTSSAFLTIPATCLKLVGIENSTLLKFSSVPKNYWQVGLDVGIILGSWLYSKQNHNPKARRTNSQITKGLLGGFLLLFGARLADGCTSGHGLSGIANLSVSSIVAVASMFAAGMLCGQINK